MTAGPDQPEDARPDAAHPPALDSGGPAADDTPAGLYTLPERLLFAVTLAMFTAMIGATLAQILFRYFLQIPVTWTEEAARALFVMAMLMGMAFAYRERQHVIVDFLFVKLPAPLQRWLGVVFNLLILVFLGFWARGALRLAEINWGSSLITVPFFRVAYFYIWELLAIALFFLYVLLDTAARVAGRAPYAEAAGAGDSETRR